MTWPWTKKHKEVLPHFKSLSQCPVWNLGVRVCLSHMKNAPRDSLSSWDIYILPVLRPLCVMTPTRPIAHCDFSFSCCILTWTHSEVASGLQFISEKQLQREVWLHFSTKGQSPVSRVTYYSSEGRPKLLLKYFSWQSTKITYKSVPQLAVWLGPWG